MANLFSAEASEHSLFSNLEIHNKGKNEQNDFGMRMSVLLWCTEEGSYINSFKSLEPCRQPFSILRLCEIIPPL